MEEDHLKKTYFLVADDHKIITQSLSLIIKSIVPNAEVQQVNKLRDVLKTLALKPMSMLVLDISFPDGITLQIIPTIKSLYPDLKILIFSGHEEELFALRYINAGANGFISKLSSEEEIENAIISVFNKGKYLSSKVKELIEESYFTKKNNNAIEKLSDRELEIANLMVEGLGNTQISDKLNLQKSTVSTYKTRIFEKLKINNISELIFLYQSKKII